jgi:hypothetical protein
MRINWSAALPLLLGAALVVLAMISAPALLRAPPPEPPAGTDLSEAAAGGPAIVGRGPEAAPIGRGPGGPDVRPDRRRRSREGGGRS